MTPTTTTTTSRIPPNTPRQWVRSMSPPNAFNEYSINMSARKPVSRFAPVFIFYMYDDLTAITAMREIDTRTIFKKSNETSRIQIHCTIHSMTAKSAKKISGWSCTYNDFPGDVHFPPFIPSGAGGSRRYATREQRRRDEIRRWHWENFSN